MPETLIQVESLSYQAKGQTILDEVNFEVHRGDYLGILGPNGGGKTTLFKLILGLLKPQSGQIRLYGQIIEQFKDHHKIGYVPQQQNIQPRLPANVEEVVLSGMAARLGPFGGYSKTDKKSAQEAMELSRVEGLKHRLISELSGGERQRVYIARALTTKPEILFLDEPVTGVDQGQQERFYQFLAQLNQEMRLTILFVSHDLGVIAKEMKNLLCLNKRLICHGPPENFVKEDFLEELYGKHSKSVLHRH